MALDGVDGYTGLGRRGADRLPVADVNPDLLVGCPDDQVASRGFVLLETEALQLCEVAGDARDSRRCGRASLFWWKAYQTRREQSKRSGPLPRSCHLSPN